MIKDLERFLEMIKEDPALQEKLGAACMEYKGEQTQEAAFNEVVVPVAAEYGCDITWEDYQEQLKKEADAAHELNLDEMEQVAGGQGGFGAHVCLSWLGIGVGIEFDKDDRTQEKGFGVCAGLGIGGGAGICVVEGVSTNRVK